MKAAVWTLVAVILAVVGIAGTALYHNKQKKLDERCILSKRSNLNLPECANR